MFHADFVDYATVAIGLYAAANGMREEDILSIENAWAFLRSKYPKSDEMDTIYKNLPERNIVNTHLGYQLYKSGRIGPSNAQKK